MNPAGMLTEPIKTHRAICDDTNTQDVQSYEICSLLSTVPFFSFSERTTSSTFWHRACHGKIGPGKTGPAGPIFDAKTGLPGPN